MLVHSRLPLTTWQKHWIIYPPCEIEIEIAVQFCRNLKAYFPATAEENGLTFQTPAAETLHKSNMDLTMSGKLQEVKKKKKRKTKNTLPTSHSAITGKVTTHQYDRNINQGNQIKKQNMTG